MHVTLLELDKYPKKNLTNRTFFSKIARPMSIYLFIYLKAWHSKLKNSPKAHLFAEMHIKFFKRPHELQSKRHHWKNLSTFFK
jgi:hypothetical protein